MIAIADKVEKANAPKEDERIAIATQAIPDDEITITGWLDF